MKKSKQVLVNKHTWQQLAKAAEQIMAANAEIKASWLDRACDMDKPDLLQGDTAWPLAFFTWLTLETAHTATKALTGDTAGR